MIKVYIAGKITGDDNYIEKFENVERVMRREGYKVLSPSIQPQGMSNKYYAKSSIAMLEECDCVYFMNDWSESNGATLERLYCDYVQKPYVVNSMRDLAILANIRNGKDNATSTN